MEKISLLILLILSLSAHALTGRVVAVKDGDSIEVLSGDNTLTKVRLADIDAPEKKQAFGQAAKKFLSDLVFNKIIDVEEIGKDRYQRTLGVVFAGDLEVNLHMVENGFAWQYKKYSKSPAYAVAEDSARKKGLGLWRDPEPVPPWEYRHPGR